MNATHYTIPLKGNEEWGKCTLRHKYVDCLQILNRMPEELIYNVSKSVLYNQLTVRNFLLVSVEKDKESGELYLHRVATSDCTELSDRHIRVTKCRSLKHFNLLISDKVMNEVEKMKNRIEYIIQLDGNPEWDDIITKKKNIRNFMYLSKESCFNSTNIEKVGGKYNVAIEQDLCVVIEKDTGAVKKLYYVNQKSAASKVASTPSNTTYFDSIAELDNYIAQRKTNQEEIESRAFKFMDHSTVENCLSHLCYALRDCTNVVPQSMIDSVASIFSQYSKGDVDRDKNLVVIEKNRVTGELRDLRLTQTHTSDVSEFAFLGSSTMIDFINSTAQPVCDNVIPTSKNIMDTMYDDLCKAPTIPTHFMGMGETTSQMAKGMAEKKMTVSTKYAEMSKDKFEHIPNDRPLSERELAYKKKMAQRPAEKVIPGIQSLSDHMHGPLLGGRLKI